jgi:hypothetical protein
VKCIAGTGLNDVPEHETEYPPVSHSHPSGQSIATLAGTITNHNQKIKAGDVNTSDTKTTARLDDMASGCNLKGERDEVILNVTAIAVRVRVGQYREELIVNVTVFVVRVWGGQYREELILNVAVFIVRVWGGQYREELILNVTVFVVRF